MPLNLKPVEQTEKLSLQIGENQLVQNLSGEKSF